MLLWVVLICVGVDFSGCMELVINGNWVVVSGIGVSWIVMFIVGD